MRFLKLASAAALLSSAALAETWSGTLVDVTCRTKDLASHTKECALNCAKGGFGLVTADGKLIKFDEAGNAKALAALKATSKEKDLKARVNGKMEEGVIQVETVEIQ